MCIYLSRFLKYRSITIILTMWVERKWGRHHVYSHGHTHTLKAEVRSDCHVVWGSQDTHFTAPHGVRRAKIVFQLDIMGPESCSVGRSLITLATANDI